MSATKERIPSRSEGSGAVLSLAAAAPVAENSRPGFATKKMNSFQGWSEVNFKTATGIEVSLRRNGVRSRCQSLNRYAYALNNPTTLIDPLGLASNNPGDPCSDIGFSDSNAGCQHPGCYLDGGWFPASPDCLGAGWPQPPYGGGGGGSVAGSGGTTTSSGSAGAATGHIPMSSGVLSGDYGPIYPLSLGQLFGLPGMPGGFGGCDFGVCGGAVPDNGFGEAAELGAEIGTAIEPGIGTTVGIVVGLGVNAYLAYRLIHHAKGGTQNAQAAKAQYERDLNICRQLKDPGARSRCYESALNRKNRREQGWDPLPPLITW